VPLALLFELELLALELLLLVLVLELVLLELPEYLRHLEHLRY
jgi:hypothetical protein